jgi:hypothetical protein
MAPKSKKTRRNNNKQTARASASSTSAILPTAGKPPAGSPSHENPPPGKGSKRAAPSDEQLCIENMKANPQLLKLLLDYAENVKKDNVQDPVRAFQEYLDKLHDDTERDQAQGDW